MNKAGKVITTIAVLAALAGSGYFFVVPQITGASENGAEENIAYVTKVEDVVNGFAFTSNRYSGVVETQEVVEVEADAEKKIKTTFVKEGDEVKTGDKLFEYDIEEMKLDLDQAKLDIEQTNSEIKAYNDRITSLEKEKRNASVNKQLTISNQIDETKLNLKKSEYEKTTLEKSIEKLEKSIKNAVVKSTVDGIVESVNDPSLDGYVRIASNGDYRIKALVSEDNIYEFYENESIVIRSRVDDVQWAGTVTSIDTAKPVTGDSGQYSVDTVTKYPVYIAIDSSDGLLIGQHVTVEKDAEAEDEAETFWIPEYMIVDAETYPYVWAESDSGVTEKRKVELGRYSEGANKYEVVSGIDKDDYIAFPEDRMEAGMYTEHLSDMSAMGGVAADGNSVGGNAEVGVG